MEAIKVVTVEPSKEMYNLHTCNICGQSFDRKYNLTRHLRIHQPKVENVECSECGKTYANKSNLKAHFIYAHPGKKMTLLKKPIFVPKKGLGPVKMIDASTQTEKKCNCHNEDEFDKPRLTGSKWKDELFVRFQLDSLPKKRKLN